MPKYVDGFLIPVPKKNVPAYIKMAKLGAKVWKEHGALEYRECIGDDLQVKGMMPFPRQLKVKPGETVAFSWIVFKSKAHRDKVNAKVMKDPRLAGMSESSAMPFEFARMCYGGFSVVVEA